MAAIVGYHTRQVLYFGVKNKYCVTCTRKPGDTHHTCFKNWNGSSSSMEAATIVALHITKRKYCILVIWTPKGLKTFEIERDDEFWKENMKEKLETFYMKCLLPELIDPRQRRSLPIREPEYILLAQAKKQK
ncbi:uncharacterized protein LOC120351536 [Nilaparvata lugens]|uniref:uncharacterized protein LOC120351536 n=1 Tax=Nilaparvata lugens TaxID=108931 RepID=UPI00193CC803|nr:uncharacterized protein LOC120351536 [Nilaparvata lugens]